MQLSISVAEDSRVLASASKEDSTAMKILAAVTVFFLPMTFIAALFSMPLFRWRETTVGESSMAEQFWVYWAVSVPLTVVTVGFCAVWTNRQMRRRQEKKDAGMKSLREMICNEKGWDNGSGLEKGLVHQK